MPELTREQRKFLKQHKIPTSMVFDATGMQRRDWQSHMKELGLRFAYGTTPCRKGKHTLKTKTGCIQCHPAFIEFTNRYYKKGFVYLACSLEKKLIKVGVGKTVEGRESSLNRLGYAGVSDWKMLYSVKVDGAGQIEFAIHSELANHNVKETYLRDGKQVVCREVFRCEMDIALLAFENHTGTRCEAIQEISQWFQEDLNEDDEDDEGDDALPLQGDERVQDELENSLLSKEERNRLWRELEKNDENGSESKSEKWSGNENEDAQPLPGDERGQDEWGNRLRRDKENSNENVSENPIAIHSLYAVSVSAIERGVKFGFTHLDKSDLQRRIKEIYPGYGVTVEHHVECPRHGRNEEIVLSKTKHLKSLSDGFREIQPLGYSITICGEILDELINGPTLTQSTPSASTTKPATTTHSPGKASIERRLQELKGLLEKGLLTRAEAAAKRKEILKEL